MEYMCDLTDEQKISRIASAGILASFVEAFEGSWNHEQWLELVSYVRDMGYSVSDAPLGLALEEERELYFLGLERNERLAARAPVIEETISFIESSDSFLSSLEKIKELASSEIGREHKKKLRLLLSEKFTQEVKGRLSNGAWIPRKLVDDVEALTKKLL